MCVPPQSCRSCQAPVIPDQPRTTSKECQTEAMQALQEKKKTVASAGLRPQKHASAVAPPWESDRSCARQGLPMASAGRLRDASEASYREIPPNAQRGTPTGKRPPLPTPRPGRRRAKPLKDPLAGPRPPALHGKSSGLGSATTTQTAAKKYRFLRRGTPMPAAKGLTSKATRSKY